MTYLCLRIILSHSNSVTKHQKKNQTRTHRTQILKEVELDGSCYAQETDISHFKTDTHVECIGQTERKQLAE